MRKIKDNQEIQTNYLQQVIADFIITIGHNNFRQYINLYMSVGLVIAIFLIVAAILMALFCILTKLFSYKLNI